MLRKFLCTLSLLLTLPGASAPARTPDDATTLTGGSQREWSYGEWGTYKSNGECDGGATWTFSSRGILTKKKCENKRLVDVSKHTLRMWTKPSGVFAITLDEGTPASRVYEVRFPATGSRKRLKMRLTWTEGDKSDGFEETDFYHIR